jgi:hypothetical protein
MSRVNKVFLVALVGAFLLTAVMVFMPNSINNYYSNPESFDTGFSYYMWKFRPIDRSNIARITAWSFFAIHLVGNMILLKRLKLDQSNKQDGLSKFNIYLLIYNAIFIVIHFLHTWIWYDALAQDTPVWSSQGSVIVMLVLILIMENKRRGLFFGKKVPFPKESTSWIVKNHGKFIVLATVFTFWYHPMEFTSFHMFGFFYMFLLFIQLSFARTKIHYNNYFKVVLEVAVLFHGTTVAMVSQNAPFAMFLFGFAAIFFVTQIYGLGLNKKLIVGSQISFLLIVILVYSGLFTDYTFVDVNEVIRIPFIEYGLAFVFVYIIAIPIFLNKRFNIPNWLNKTSRILLYIILGVSAISVMYINSPYTPEPEMYEFIELNSNVTRSDTSKAIVLEPSTYENNIVFIPGGKVMPEAYLYLATELANQGMKVTIIKPIANLAILQPNLGSKYLEEGKTNIVMGHSLGGVVSSMVVSKHPDINYLVLLGSYNLGEIESTETLIISAEFDIQMDWDTYDENTKSINNLTEVMIEGGNHAYFGYYGNQRGDGEAEMSNKEQQDLVVGYIIDFLE